MKYISNVPWWLISAGLHAVVMLGAALIYVERLLAIEVTPVYVSTRDASSFPLIPEPDIVRDTFTRKGLPSDDSENRSANDEPVIFNPLAKKSDHNESANNED